jgi:hypothetical protein
LKQLQTPQQQPWAIPDRDTATDTADTAASNTADTTAAFNTSNPTTITPTPLSTTCAPELFADIPEPNRFTKEKFQKILMELANPGNFAKNIMCALYPELYTEEQQ